MSARLIIGDVLEVLRSLPDNSVDLVLTSPPFLALRSYLPADHPDKGKELGSEPTPGEFIDTLLDVVEECRRVLAPHGSLCFELGDTYAGSGGAGGDYGAGGWREGQEAFKGSVLRYRDAKYERLGHDHANAHPIRNLHGKRQGGGDGWPLSKSLTLVPELFRIALVYGFNPLTGRETPQWRARNVVRWVRPNLPVGALGDKFRPATSEMVVACTSRTRYFDLDSVREPFAGHSGPSAGVKYASGEAGSDVARRSGQPRVNTHAGAPPLDWWAIPTEPFAGAHYATWPRELCVKPIRAMCPERVCRTCGEPSRRIVEKSEAYKTVRAADTSGCWTDDEHGKHVVFPSGPSGFTATYDTLGWTDCSCSGCNCDDHPVGAMCAIEKWRPGLVLDCFAGSGTTLAVATGHGRDAIGIDLDSRNADLAMQRVGMFLTVEHFNGSEPERERPVVDVELPEVTVPE